MSLKIPSEEDNQELLLSCRYGELDDLTLYIAPLAPTPSRPIRDDSGNTVLHMIAANGHSELLSYLLPHIPPALLAQPNASGGSTPLHWAALNGQLMTMRQLIEWAPGPGIELIEARNHAGRSPLAEAEIAGFQEGAKYLASVMRLDDNKDAIAGAGEDVGEEGEGNDGEGLVDGGDVQVEIEDADGGIARMTISSGGDVKVSKESQLRPTTGSASTSTSASAS